ncbi:gluconokinase [Kitasatospora brasiliensis]|uniref:gluconokinase n=1 Tax=Kitasatospora brasiliensis TaxID=3058040 RepID=UPI002930484B|nr:gluconokinase [Kitasatospora sp. K002]
MSLGTQRPYVVVMGVSGTGKSTVARLLAERLAVPFADGDDFHRPDSIARMAAGIPLDDARRRPWLEAIGGWLREREAAGTGGVVTCSALKRRYRDTLRAACPGAFFLHLTGGHDLLASRLHRRRGHFMPTTLLDSQLAALEPLEPDERGAALDVGPAPELIVDAAMGLLTCGG